MQRSDLSAIVQFASQEKGSKTSVLFLLALASAVSPVTYIKPSYAEIPPYGLPDGSTVRILQVISTWLPTTALLYLACLDFISARKKLSIPTELAEILEGLSLEEIRCQDIGIGIISTLSAIPLTTPLIKFPLVNTGDKTMDSLFNTLLVMSILLANGIAHLRPLQIIINNPWYGAPIFGVKYLARSCRERYMTPAEREHKKIAEEKLNKNMKLNTHLIQTLNLKKTKLIDNCFVRNNYGYKIQLNDNFQRIYESQDDLLIFELSTAIELKEVTITNRQKFYNFFLFVVSQIGAALALGISVGYLADSGFELSAKVFNNDIEGWMAAAIPILAFAVLIHNAARVETLENVDFAIGFARGEQTFSWPIKYCAKLYFGLLLPPSVALMLLNASAASVMFRVDFKDYCSNDFINTYLSIFRWGYVWLANLLMKNITKYLFTKWAENFGTDEAKKIAHFDQRINNILDRLSQWKGERLQSWLIEQSPELRKQLLNISEDHYQTLAVKESDEEKGFVASPPSSQPVPQPKPVSTCEWIFSFFCCRKRKTSSTDYYSLADSAKASQNSLQC